MAGAIGKANLAQSADTFIGMNTHDDWVPVWLNDFVVFKMNIKDFYTGNLHSSFLFFLQ